MDIAVGLVKAYLELCGYFVLAELPVRAPDGAGYHDVTDLDVIAVHFPHPPPALAPPLARPLEVFLGQDPALETFTAGMEVLIGEVKEGQARLNPALHRTETIAFALRRVGCCPEAAVPPTAQVIATTGAYELAHAGGWRCRVRLVVFAGHGRAAEPGVFTLPLAHCNAFIGDRLHAAEAVLAGAQFKDPVLGLLALQAKLARAQQR